MGVGYLVADAGFVLLIVAAILAAVGVRRPQRSWPLRAVAVITGVYVIALVLAMGAMPGKRQLTEPLRDGGEFP